MACSTVFRCTDAVCPAKKAFASGEGRFHDVQVLTRDGQRRYIENIAIPVLNGKGKGEVKRVLLLSMDITDREKRIHQLSLLTQLGDALQYTLQSDKVFQLVLTCVTAGHALGFNRAMLFLVNKEQDAVCGRMAIGPSNLEQAYEVWQKIKHHTLEGLLEDVAEMDPLESELNIKTKLLAFPVTAGDEIVVRCLNEKEPLVVKDAANDPRVTEEFLNAIGAGEFVCVPLMVKGRAIGVIVADNVYSGEPITAEHVRILSIFAKSAALAIENAETYKELEDKVSQLTETQEKLLRTERLVAIGEMASYVAHEIRNPLVTIGGFARSMERICADDEKINTSSKIIVQEVERLEKILDDIRDFSRPAEPRKASLRIDELVKDTLDIIEGYLREKGITVERELEHDIPEVLADAAQMKQVFLNLLRNAAESMPGGGAVRVGVCTEGDWVRIRFADTGEGMSSEVMGKLFTPFFTTKSGGTGVGLAISHKIIDDHDGRLNVSSTEGSGSVFSIFIPLHYKGQEARKGGKQ
jgi:signal transduction histidine kinase